VKQLLLHKSAVCVESLGGGAELKEVTSLSKGERIFLAGCLKNMILADGAFDEAELNELDVVLEELEFSDYEECLTEFEDLVTDNESFWEMAETVDDRETQELILEVLFDLSIQKGIEESTEKNFLGRLKQTWQM
jgi:hypothetical protein